MTMMSRRQLLIAGGLLTVSACGSGAARSSGSNAGDGSSIPTGPVSTSGATPEGEPVTATDPVVAAREADRQVAGSSTVSATVTAAPIETRIGGRTVNTWAFGERPGTGGIRAKVGDVVEARFVNRLDAANTVHWHGIALRNDMDGVHDLTQAMVDPGSEFTYRFTVADSGTFWFHPHMGLELDRGLYAPLIVEDPDDGVDADVDAVLMLDDWLDGFGRSAQDVLAELQSGGGHSGHMGDMGDMGGMGGMGMGGMTESTGGGHSGHMGGSSGMSSMMRGLVGDVEYPLHLVNGRGPDDRDVVVAKPGQRVRLRLINAGSDTAYRVAVGDHRLTVTHADGFPVDPVEVDNVVLGMGERYDVVLTAGDGAFPIVAVPEGKTDAAAEAILRTSAETAAPPTGARPAELARSSVNYADLHAAERVRLSDRAPDRRVELTLTADMNRYVHGIDGASFPDTSPVVVRQGERLRLAITNMTMMFHPIHLHGHTFQMVGEGSARKDTVSILPMSTVTVDIEADNPGQWMLHCHNTYHLETGMATVLSYRA